MKKILLAKLTTGLLVLGVAGLVSGSPALATSWMIGDNDGYGQGIADNRDHNMGGFTSFWDGRSNGDKDTPNEVGATNGAQFTDTYSTTHPGYSPQDGAVATFMFTGIGNNWTKGSIEFDMADFESATYGPVTVTYNLIPQTWGFNDGYGITRVRSFDLSQAVLDSIKTNGELIVVIDRNGSEDFYGFDYVKLSNQPVPEPTTMLLFGAGLAGLAAVGRRRTH